MADAILEIQITPTAPSRGATVTAPLVKVLTTVGSEPAADVRVQGLPARWGIVQRSGDAVLVRAFGAGESQTMRADERIVLAGAEIRVVDRSRTESSGPGLPIARLTDALCGAESANDALRVMLRGILEATSADKGAIIVSERGDYHVALAEEAGGAPVEDAAQLLSDTIVRDALDGNRALCVPDAALHNRYANVPSVLALRLRSVICVPMTLSGRVLGAFYLGKHDLRGTFSERHVADLAVLAQMAVPLLVQLRRSDGRRTTNDDLIVGECASIGALRAMIARVAHSDLGVLVLGETGTGKELVARSVHAASPRAGKPMIAVNCSAVPETLLGAELFGARRGAFTGAIADRKGLIEEANGSTLFLDEVGDMPLSMQAALLRVLEQREVTRLGENTPRPVDFRLVAATHKDLNAEVDAGRFRRDLMFRLQEFTVTLPPLRERGDDIVLLATLFLRQAEAQFSLPLHALADDARHRLLRHPWPGNVRELRATMRRASLLCDGPAVRAEHLQLEERADREPNADDLLGDLDRPLAEARDAFVANYVRAVLARHGGNRERAAAALGISVRSLYRMG